MEANLQETLLSIIQNDIPSTRAQNEIAESNISQINDDKLKNLNDSFNRHTRINFSMVWILAAGLVFISTIFVFGYLRLSDKIDSTSDAINLRIDNEKEAVSGRLDQMQQFNILRTDKLSENLESSLKSTSGSERVSRKPKH